MKVLVAPDSFKGTATAQAAAAAIAAGWTAVRPDDEVRLLPFADGGEGTIDAFEAAQPGAVRHPVEVRGPDDRPVGTSWLGLPDGTAVVELASTSGITLLDPLRPGTAHTIGFGEAVVAALDAGAARLVLAIGGSSSTDGGAGLLSALGARVLDAHGDEVAPGNVGLGSADHVDRAGLRRPPPGGVEVVTDVTAPLLGPNGAAAVFGPQKGVAPDQVAAFDDRLARFAALLPEVDPSTPGAGAAGGAGFGLLAWGARLTAGAEAIGAALGLDALLADSDLLITGEGRFDGQSTTGKVAGSLLQAARAAAVPCALVAGTIDADPSAFQDAIALTELAGSTTAAMTDPLRWLDEAARVLALRVR